MVPLESDILRHINLSGGTSRGPSTVLRGGKLRWPLVLQEEVYAAERQQINELLPRAVKEVQDGDLQLATYKALNGALGSLKAKIDGLAPNMSLQDIMHAQRYANQIGSSISLLRDPNAANYFNGKWEARGAHVGELVDNMIRNGLSFAPAAETDRTAYQALYQAMSTYDTGLTSLVRR